jgi:hypothetical protein
MPGIRSAFLDNWSGAQLCKGKASRGQQRNRPRLLGRKVTGAELCFNDLAIPI